MPAQSVRTVQTSRHFASRVQARYRSGRPIGINADAAHHVEESRADLHGFFRDIDVSQLFELLVHRRQAASDVVCVTARCDIQEDATVWGPATRFHRWE